MVFRTIVVKKGVYLPNHAIILPGNRWKARYVGIMHVNGD